MHGLHCFGIGFRETRPVSFGEKPQLLGFGGVCTGPLTPGFDASDTHYRPSRFHPISLWQNMFGILLVSFRQYPSGLVAINAQFLMT